MATPQTQTKQHNVEGTFSTAEVTHIIKAIQLEGMCYRHNHLDMRLAGIEGPIREFHDNVTRPNLDRLTGIAKEMGVPLPFPVPLEERENEIKAKLQGTNVEGTVTEGEAIADVLARADQIATFYTVSFNLATHEKVLDAFRRNLQTVMDNKPRVEMAFKNTKEYVAPPVARNVELVGALSRGVQPGQAGGGARGG